MLSSGRQTYTNSLIETEVSTLTFSPACPFNPWVSHSRHSRMQRVVKGGVTEERERRTGVREAQRGEHWACNSLKGGQWGEGVCSVYSGYGVKEWGLFGGYGEKECSLYEGYSAMEVGLFGS